jgi:hypothetical protein
VTLHERCRCDPVESGEENCNGGCLLRAELAAAEARVADLTVRVRFLDALAMRMEAERDAWRLRCESAERKIPASKR